MKKIFNLDGRLAAWDIMRQLNITSLPVNPIRIANQLSVEVISYDALSEIRKVSSNDLQAQYSNDEFTYFKNSQQIQIFYNTNIQSKGRRRWTLTHERAHVILHHISAEAPMLNRSHIKGPEDIEADKLVQRILCPSGVLYLCR